MSNMFERMGRFFQENTGPYKSKRAEKVSVESEEDAPEMTAEQQESAERQTAKMVEEGAQLVNGELVPTKKQVERARREMEKDLDAKDKEVLDQLDYEAVFILKEALEHTLLSTHGTDYIDKKRTERIKDVIRSILKERDKEKAEYERRGGKSEEEQLKEVREKLDRAA